MSSLSFVEKRKLESILGMNSWYVLDFSNRVFSECIKDTVDIDIYQEKYWINWDSKANRLRIFWQIESDEKVGKLLYAFWEYSNNQDIKNVANRLLWINNEKQEETFEKMPIPKIDITNLGLFSSLETTINQRLHEIKICLENWWYLAAIFLCWSTMEWILLNYISSNPKECNSAKAAPKIKDTQKVKLFQEWSLNDMINVIFEIGVFDNNIKKFSHNLRDFRNYIHPFQQASEWFSPDKHTAEISYKILMLAIDKIICKLQK